MPYADPEKRREYHRKYNAARNLANPEPARAASKKYWENHSLEVRARQAADFAKRSAAQARRRAADPERYNAYARFRHAENENARIADRLRSAINSALRLCKSGRDWRQGAKLRAIVGCSKPDLIAHIEAQFLPGMSWSNYGRKGWELDHLKQCASFDLTQHDQVLLCFHYTNLRPLWRADNNRRPRKE
jgi:Prasinovirus endonuclease VII